MIVNCFHWYCFVDHGELLNYCRSVNVIIIWGEKGTRRNYEWDNLEIKYEKSVLLDGVCVLQEDKGIVVIRMMAFHALP